ncbi:hypothetical protein M8R20_11105 [Pseudomonas sp. R2.Fl]|nr:hypothetical protein [Pseudomonas sp. R2.Fl]
MTGNFHPIATLREIAEQIGRAVSASAEYTRAADANRSRGATAIRLGQNGLSIPL